MMCLGTKEVHLLLCRGFFISVGRSVIEPGVSERMAKELVATCAGCEARLPGLESQVFQLLAL